MAQPTATDNTQPKLTATQWDQIRRLINEFDARHNSLWPMEFDILLGEGCVSYWRIESYIHKGDGLNLISTGRIARDVWPSEDLKRGDILIICRLAVLAVLILVHLVAGEIEDVRADDEFVVAAALLFGEQNRQNVGLVAPTPSRW